MVAGGSDDGGFLPICSCKLDAIIGCGIPVAGGLIHQAAEFGAAGIQSGAGDGNARYSLSAKIDIGTVPVTAQQSATVIVITSFGCGDSCGNGQIFQGDLAWVGAIFLNIRHQAADPGIGCTGGCNGAGQFAPVHRDCHLPVGLREEARHTVIGVVSVIGQRGSPFAVRVCTGYGRIRAALGDHARHHYHRGAILIDSNVCAADNIRTGDIPTLISGKARGPQSLISFLIVVAICGIHHRHFDFAEKREIRDGCIAHFGKQAQIAMGFDIIISLPCPQLAGSVSDVQRNGAFATVKSPGKGITVAVIPPDTQNAGAGKVNQAVQRHTLRDFGIHILRKFQHIVFVVVVGQSIANKIGGSVESIFPVGSGEIVDGQSMRSAVEFEQTTLNRIIRKIWASQPHDFAPVADVGSVARSWQRTGGNGIHQTIAIFADDPALVFASADGRHSDGAVQPQNALGQFSHKAACEAAVYSSRCY